ncbi:hypothetical protein [Leptospira bandrabouensis]|uniref:Uncharacterized protein n=1 Tax=Leptospira bandrabouensis TaxID=2484903 RepID=A0A6H3NQI6_9LEPT|nr:hypothetical protein [Leptospira bandrabouensis]MCG6154106.1 hypothetical protein [Leptospira bandrabouensis]TGN10319.1 hypothetical protein EHR08_19615 [Leptospira bandrabouensis]
MKKVYLDLNFINYMGDGKRNQWTNTKYEEIYKSLVKAVNSGKLICPGSSPVFFELSKQDLDTIQSGAQIVDELSKGKCILSKYRILKQELENFITYIESGKIEKKFPDEKIWGTGGMIIDLDEETLRGIIHPEAYEKTLAKIKSATWEGMYSRHGKQIKETDIYNGELPEITENLQSLKEKLKDKNIKFKELQIIELTDTINSSIKLFPEVARNFKLKQSDIDLTSKFLSREVIPFMYAYASIYALLRYDKRRKLKPNDIYDIDHSSIGLAYYDIIFTERSFYSLMKDSLANLDIIYEVKLAKTSEEALLILKEENSV